MNPRYLEDTLYNVLAATAEARKCAADAQNTLADLARDMAAETEAVAGLRTFRRERDGNDDAGLVITLTDGSEFRITIVQSKQGTSQG